MVKTTTVIASDRRERSNLVSVKRDCRVGPAALLAMTICFGLGILLIGCSVPPAQIPNLPKDHPANRFYRAAQAGMLSDKVCLDDGGNPGIPAAKVQTGEGYIRTPDLIPGVSRFRDISTGKNYLGVAFLQRSGFLQLPKICSWEEKDNNG